ncbi:MAG: sulfatase [Candidatus Hydrogenedentales bacterium]
MATNIWIRRGGRWLFALLYTLAIFFLAQYVPAFWSWLTTEFGTEAAGRLVDRAVPLAGLVVLVLAVAFWRVRRPVTYLWLLVAMLGYAYLLTLYCEYPVERIHLLQYSLLAWAYYRALRLDTSYPAAIAGAAVAVVVVGVADELIQHFLAGRSGTVADTLLNWFAGGLGLIALVALHRDRLEPVGRPMLRYGVGLVVPLLLVALLSHQIWTRYLFPPINLILITVDCARPDHMGLYGYERDTTRYLGPFMHGGAVFTNAFSQAAWTGAGVVSTLTGLYPPTHGVDRANKINRAVVTTILDGYRERGYQVPDLSYLTEDPTFQNLGAVDPTGIDLSKISELEAILNWIEVNHEDPFAIWYHFRHLHLPYAPPAHHRVFPPADGNHEDEKPPLIRDVIEKEVIIPFNTVEFKPVHRPWIHALYDGHMRQFDGAFEAIRYKLALHHVLRNTLIVITADHGEELMDHGYVGHASTMLHSRHNDEHIHIPLLIWGPRIVPGGRVLDTVAQQVDILPTIFDLMGWPIPEEVQGRSLVPAIRGENMEDVLVFGESIEGGYQSKAEMQDLWLRSVRTREWKLLVRSSPEDDRYELYNLLVDPNEYNNVFEQHPEVANGLLLELTKWLSESEAMRQRIEAKETELQARAATGDVDPSLLSAPTIVEPQEGDVISFDETGGKVTLRWEGHPHAHYIIEYDVGDAFHKLTGQLPVHGTEKTYGPLPREGWKPLYQWNPYHIRVRPRDLPNAWSDWITVEVAPLEE